MGKSVRSDFFKQFNSSLNILKMIYIDIPKNDSETAKISEQTIKPFLDGSITSNDEENLSFIKEEHFVDGQIDSVGQVKYISDILSSSNSYPELANEYSQKMKEPYSEKEKIVEIKSLKRWKNY